MKIIIILLILLLQGTVYAETIMFAPLPLSPKETIIGGYLPIADYLKKKTGLPIELVYISDYQAIMDNFKSGKIGIVTFGPLPYVELKKVYQWAEPIAIIREKDGSSSYSCALITSAKGPNRIKDLKGPVAVTQKNSTCGYFTANIMLSGEGKDIKALRYTHLSTHNEVAEAVIRGEYEAGSLKMEVAERYKGYGIKLLKESLKWTGIAIVVNSKTLSKDKIKAIKDAIVSLNPKEYPDLVVGKYGFAEATDRDFEVVRRYERYTK